ncbi:SDR family oxidoreductase [Qipengyuania sp.]|uniref:SDR family oxidoreductase n=1 Tax=Qipengyuania sp. TaxID=2004515 RepID=UPI0035C81CCB
MKISGNTILLTGGSSGIGRELARRWHDLGNTVIIASRNRDALDKTAEGYENIHVMILDAGKGADIGQFVRDAIEKFPAINVLVNNAGIMKFEDITGSRDLSDAEAEIETNLLGPIRLIDGFIDHLKGQADAAVINVTSGLAFVPLPKAATYSATKAALHSYTVSLRAKLKDAVEVIEIAPPGVQTELTPGQSEREEYMPLDEFIDETMKQFEAAETPPEVLTEPVKPFRHAERDGKFDDLLAMLATR